MAVEVSINVNAFSSCAKDKGRYQKKHHRKNLFSTTGPILLYDIAIDLLEHIMKTWNNNQYIIVITDWYIKLSPTVPMSKNKLP